MADFGAETTGDAVVSHFPKQIQGRTFLINGVTPGGIGAGIAISLARSSPSRLVLLAKADDANQLQDIVDEIKTRDASVAVTAMISNPSELSSVRSAAEKILGNPDIIHIDVVINVQTEMPRPFTKTGDGHEYLLQTNYLSQFLLTTKVLPKILSAARPRIVNISSSANQISGMRFDDLNFEQTGSYEPWTAYGQTKTAAILFTVALNSRLASSQHPEFRSYAVHPGGVKTKLQEQLSDDALKKAYEATKLRFGELTANDFFRWKTLSAAISTPLRAALDPLLPSRDGMWLEDCELYEESVHLADHATDLGYAQRLWNMSEELVSEKPKI
ncbi:short-chain dehydrogenase [Colletotrichum incanum]|uniref:Short-chain dehydrogenase n=1 Tax=Colletotrichum incanum TaxID=1573173 RepID=A0A167DKT0_COLIC|nr:short-chain dehydrogenase [Colletotrichum incanum]